MWHCGLPQWSEFLYSGSHEILHAKQTIKKKRCSIELIGNTKNNTISSLTTANTTLQIHQQDLHVFQQRGHGDASRLTNTNIVGCFSMQ